MQKKLEELVQSFPTTPILFMGSGISKRYLNLPSWEELLKVFASRLSKDPFKFRGLMNAARDDLTLVGSSIEKEFSDRWFSDPEFRTDSRDIKELVDKGTSPFKAELAHYLKKCSQKNQNYNDEIEMLKALTVRNISGFITTNYDTFLEDLAEGYKVYSNQEELLFSSIQGIGEIFKIHGTVTQPSSIVITNEDYERFDSKSAYLAAKLTTVFVEYPVIFMGYSLTDANIRKILTSIVRGLSSQHLDKLSNRLIFVKRNKNLQDSVEIHPHSIDIDGHLIPTTQIETNDFSLIYKALRVKKSGYPARLLRLFHEELYRYSLTETCSKHCVVSPYDPNLPDDAVVFSVGVDDRHLLHGLTGITSKEWYRGIMFDDELAYSADELLLYGYPQIIRGSNTLPVYKYLGQAKGSFSGIKTVDTFDELVSKTIRKDRERMNCLNRSVRGVIDQFSYDLCATLRYLAYLTEREIDVDALGEFIKETINNHPECLESGQKEATHMKRLIRIYDWLKYKKR